MDEQNDGGLQYWQTAGQWQQEQEPPEPPQPIYIPENELPF